MRHLNRTRQLAAGILLAAAFTSLAALGPSTGYRGSTLFDTLGTFTLIEGLDIASDDALIGFGTNVWAISLDDGSTNKLGTLPGNVSVAFVQQRDTTVHAAIGQSFSFPFPSRHGALDGLGSFQDFGGIDGIYDAAVDSSNTLYIVANPGGAGTVIYRFVPADTSVVQVINVGSYSGGIAFDSQDRLYVAEQSAGEILRFTPAQLSAGSLTAADGTSIVSVAASYLCFDEHDRLYAVSGFGNTLAQYDSESGALIRNIAIDTVTGFGIGRVRWDSGRKQLLVLYADFVSFDSVLSAVTFSDSNEGVPGTSTVFQGWVASYRDFVRADTNSGGYARDDANSPSSVGAAVIGKPAVFDPFAWPVGHILSLGNGGSITLEFDDVIVNGAGSDFTVFENAFFAGTGTFSEFAFVEVATTTNAWARFPVTYYNTNAVGAFDVMDVTRVDGLAGKHELAYGTPFDLDWLKNDTNVISGSVDLNRIAYVRLTDAIGNGSKSDQFGQPVYDPYDGGAPLSVTDGFDLRGIGVMHHRGVEMINDSGSFKLSWYGYNGRAYQLAKSQDGKIWQDVGVSIAGTGGVHCVVLPMDNISVMFRIDQQIPFTP